MKSLVRRVATKCLDPLSFSIFNFFIFNFQFPLTPRHAKTDFDAEDAPEAIASADPTDETAAGAHR
jgi:hypothetical protein